MGSLAISNKMLKNYLQILRKLDNRSKKQIIISLTESIETPEKPAADLNEIYGAWDDPRDSDEIIKEIKESRVNYNRLEKF